jgi:hypothetical protein
LQSICEDEVFWPLSPLFIPPNANLDIVKKSILAHILNKHIQFLGGFLKHCAELQWAEHIESCKMLCNEVIVFKGQNQKPVETKTSVDWGEADPHIQEQLLQAILKLVTLIQGTSATTDFVPTMLETIWSSALFWMPGNEGQSHNPNPHIGDIEPSALQVLVKALHEYEALAVMPMSNGKQLSTAMTSQLLAFLAAAASHPMQADGTADITGHC